MRKDKIKIWMVFVAVLTYSTTAVMAAGLDVFYPTGTHTNDWNNSNNWEEVLNWFPGETETPAGPPTWTSGVYLYETSSDYPMAVLPGDTAHADYLYMGGGESDLYGDRFDIYGTLDLVDSVGYDSILFGHAGAVINPPSAVLTVHDGGYINARYIYGYGGDASHIDYFVQNGGTVLCDYFYMNAYDICPSQLAYLLNGGILTLAHGDGVYTGAGFTPGSTSDYLTMDIAGGTLEMSSAGFDILVAGGCILAEGTTVTMSNIDSLLEVNVEDDLAIVTLIPKPVMVVSIDIKPNSCPNPVNTKSQGVLPVAILGTDICDVNDIDPNSIMLEGTSPLRYSYEDVVAPKTDPNDCVCTTDGPDGYMDLTLKFDTQELLSVLGEVNDGEEWLLHLTGSLHDGTEIEGSDCIIILKKGKK